MANTEFTTAHEAAQDLNGKLFDGKGGKETERALEDAVISIGLASVVAEANAWPKKEIDGFVAEHKAQIQDTFDSEQER